MNKSQQENLQFLENKRAKLKNLFDIAKCNCYRECQSFQDTHFVACSCLHEEKIPELDLSFYIDQLTLRKQYIAGVDMGTTRTLCEREMRRSAKEKQRERHEREKLDSTKEAEWSRSFLAGTDSSSCGSNDSGTLFQGGEVAEISERTRNTKHYPNTIRTAKRYNA